MAWLLPCAQGTASCTGKEAPWEVWTHGKGWTHGRAVNGICECQHADQTYLKEVVGNKMMRKEGGSGTKLICELSPWAGWALLCWKLWLFSPCETLFPGTNSCFQSPQHHKSHFPQVILVWPHHSQGTDLFRISLSLLGFPGLLWVSFTHRTRCWLSCVTVDFLVRCMEESGSASIGSLAPCNSRSCGAKLWLWPCITQEGRMNLSKILSHVPKENDYVQEVFFIIPGEVWPPKSLFISLVCAKKIGKRY